MKIYHIIKKSKCDTQFRTIILSTLHHLKVKNVKMKVYIASGFFNEAVNLPRIPVSEFTDPQVSGQSLKNLLSGVDVEIFGAYNHKNDLILFAQRLKNAGANVKAFYKNKFHTKMFVIEVEKKAIFEIIGSSNMTIPAYEGLRHGKVNKFTSYNSESDLVLFDEFIIDTNIQINENVMQLKYDEQGNGNITIQDRMDDALKQFDIFKNSGMTDITKELK